MRVWSMDWSHGGIWDPSAPGKVVTGCGGGTGLIPDVGMPPWALAVGHIRVGFHAAGGAENGA